MRRPYRMPLPRAFTRRVPHREVLEDASKVLLSRAGALKALAGRVVSMEDPGDVSCKMLELAADLVKLALAVKPL